MKRKINTLYDNIDIIFSIIVLIGMILLYFFIHIPLMYILPFIFILFTALIFLLTRNRIKKDWIHEFEEKSIKYSTLLILNILFFIIFSISIFLISNINYTRPIEYFIAITFAIGILTIEIIYLNKHNVLVYFSLFKVILIALNLRITIQYLFENSFIWYDPWFHKMISESIVNNGFIPTNTPYSTLPIMHLFFSSLSITTGIDNFIILNCIAFAIKSILIILLLFLIGWKFLDSKKIGILSSLIYTIMDRTIILDISFIPTSLAIIFVLLIIYLFLKRESKKYETDYNILYISSIILFFMGVLILTHSLTSVLILLFLFSGILIQKILKHKDKKLIGITLAIFFFVALISYWTFVSGYYIAQLVNIIKWGFNTNFISPHMSFETTTSYLSRISPVQQIFSYLGFAIFLGFFIFGCFYSFYIKNKYLLFFSFFAIIIFIMTFFGIIFKIYTIPDRWWYYLQHIATVVMIVGMLSLFYGVLKNKKIQTVLTVIFIVLISFFNITDPVANIDTPIYSNELTVRHAYIDSEIQSVTTISNIFKGNIFSDIQWAVSYQSSDNFSITTINESLITNKNYLHFNGLVVFRKNIIEGDPFDAHGLYKISNNPIIYMNKENFSKIYDCGSVYGFSK